MRKWFPAILVLCGFAISIAVYRQLPDPVPADLRGLLPVAIDAEVDVLPRPVAAFGLPTLALILLMILHEAPARSLGRAAWRLADARDGGQGLPPVEYDKFAPSYRLIVSWVVMLVLAVHFALLSSVLSWRLAPGLIVGAVFGAGLIVIGNVMPRLRPNAIAGIRTAQTMRDPRLWARVHRTYGAFWLVAGIAVLIVAFVAPRYSLATGVAALLVSSLAMLVVLLLGRRSA